MTKVKTTSVDETPKISSAEDILKIKSPAAIEEIYTEPISGITVKIKGYANFREQLNMSRAISDYTKLIRDGKLFAIPKDASDGEIQLAVMLEKAVVEPKLSAIQWYQAAGESTAEGAAPVWAIYRRVLVANREMADEVAIEVEDLEKDPLDATSQTSA